MHNIQTWDIFISYSSADSAPAAQLYHELSLMVPTVKLFLDSKCIRLGDDWDNYKF